MVTLAIPNVSGSLDTFSRTASPSLHVNFSGQHTFSDSDGHPASLITVGAEGESLADGGSYTQSYFLEFFLFLPMRDLDLILPDQHRDGRVCNHDNKSPSRCIAGNVEDASRYPHMSASLPLRGTDQFQAFNEKLSLYGLWRGRSSAIHPVCGKQASYLLT